MPARFLIPSEEIINFNLLNHEQIRTLYKNSYFFTDHSLNIPNKLEFTCFSLAPLLYILYRLHFFTLYLIIFTKRNPHRIFAAGGALVLTQEKKRLKYIRKLGNIRKISNLGRHIA